MSSNHSAVFKTWPNLLGCSPNALGIRLAALLLIVLYSLTVRALDQQTLDDLQLIGAKPDQNFESIRKNARKLISANFPDHTDKALPKEEYRREFTRRGHFCDQVRKTLFRIEQKFKQGSLPDTPDKSAGGRRHRIIDFSEYQFDPSAEFDQLWKLFRVLHDVADPSKSEQTQMTLNPRPQFSDFDSWLEQFNDFQLRLLGNDRVGSQRSARLSQNLSYILSTLSPDFRAYPSVETVGRVASRAQLAFRQLLGVDLAKANSQLGSPSLSGGSGTGVIQSTLLSRLVSMAIETSEGRSSLTSIIEHLILGSAYFYNNRKSGIKPSNGERQDLDLNPGLQLILDAVAAGAGQSSLENRFAFLLELKSKTFEIIWKSFSSDRRYDHGQTKSQAVKIISHFLERLNFGNQKSDLFRLLLRESQKILAEPNPFISARRPLGETTSEAGAVLDIALAANMLNDLRSALGIEDFDRLDPDGRRRNELEKKPSAIMTCQHLFSS